MGEQGTAAFSFVQGETCPGAPAQSSSTPWRGRARRCAAVLPWKIYRVLGMTMMGPIGVKLSIEGMDQRR